MPSPAASLRSSASSSATSSSSSHHRRKSSVSTRRETAEIMGIAPPPETETSEDEHASRDEIRKRALLALEGGGPLLSGFSRVEIPDWKTPGSEAKIFDWEAPSSSLVGKRDSFGQSLVRASLSSKVELQTLVEEDEEDEGGAASSLVPTTRITKPTPHKPRPASLVLRRLSLVEQQQPTPASTPSPRTGMRPLTLGTSISNAASPTTPSPQQASPSILVARRNSQLSNKRTSSPSGLSIFPNPSSPSTSISESQYTYPLGVRTPQSSVSSSVDPSLSLSLSASERERIRPASPTELSHAQHAYTLQAHASLLARISALEHALASVKRSSTPTSSPTIMSSTSAATITTPVTTPHDELIALVADLKSERDELAVEVGRLRAEQGRWHSDKIRLEKERDDALSLVRRSEQQKDNAQLQRMEVFRMPVKVPTPAPSVPATPVPAALEHNFTSDPYSDDEEDDNDDDCSAGLAAYEDEPTGFGAYANEIDEMMTDDLEDENDDSEDDDSAAARNFGFDDHVHSDEDDDNTAPVPSPSVTPSPVAVPTQQPQPPQQHARHTSLIHVWRFPAPSQSTRSSKTYDPFTASFDDETEEEAAILAAAASQTTPKKKSTSKPVPPEVAQSFALNFVDPDDEEFVAFGGFGDEAPSVVKGVKEAAKENIAPVAAAIPVSNLAPSPVPQQAALLNARVTKNKLVLPKPIFAAAPLPSSVKRTSTDGATSRTTVSPRSSDPLVPPLRSNPSFKLAEIVPLVPAAPRSGTDSRNNSKASTSSSLRGVVNLQAPPPPSSFKSASLSRSNQSQNLNLASQKAGPSASPSTPPPAPSHALGSAPSFSFVAPTPVARPEPEQTNVVSFPTTSTSPFSMSGMIASFMPWSPRAQRTAPPPSLTTALTSPTVSAGPITGASVQRAGSGGAVNPEVMRERLRARLVQEGKIRSPVSAPPRWSGEDMQRSTTPTPAPRSGSARRPQMRVSIAEY